MNINNLFNVCIPELWAEAQEKRISWTQCNEILSEWYELLRNLHVEERPLRALFWLALVANEREYMDSLSRVEYLMERHKRILLT